IDPSVNSSLTINCTFRPDSSSSMAALISLIVSRTKDLSQPFQELASINVKSDSQVNHLVNHSFVATGNISATSDSSLLLSWTNPSERQPGSYRCTAQGVDNVGHQVVATQDVHITAILSITDQLNFELDSFEASLNIFQHNVTIFQNKRNQELQDLRETLKSVETTENFFRHKLQTMKTTMFNRTMIHSNHTYYLSEDVYRHDDINSAVCELFGGYLVEVDDVDEQEALKAFMENGTDYFGILISGSGVEREGRWLHQRTGLPVNYTDWRPGEPDDGVVYNCVTLEKFKDEWSMTDNKCHQNPFYIRYVCEMPF
ncbi:unnamed protein product, partial [Lymnaea stagnalis]